MWLKSGNPPDILLEVTLCRDVYKCLPSELDEEDYARISAHVVVMGAEARVDRESK